MGSRLPSKDSICCEWNAGASAVSSLRTRNHSAYSAGTTSSVRTVAGERLRHAIGVAAAQRLGRVPRQQSFYLLMLRLLVYRVHGQPLSIPSDLSSSASRLRA